jgi:hypothetical protein
MWPQLCLASTAVLLPDRWRTAMLPARSKKDPAALRGQQQTPRYSV